VGAVGIASHFEDERAFGPALATISLLAPVLMTLKQPLEHDNDCEVLAPNGMVKVLLEPQSLLMMYVSPCLLVPLLEALLQFG
jgi:hypothetical protein